MRHHLNAQAFMQDHPVSPTTNEDATAHHDNRVISHFSSRLSKGVRGVRKLCRYRQVPGHRERKVCVQPKPTWNWHELLSMTSTRGGRIDAATAASRSTARFFRT